MTTAAASESTPHLTLTLTLPLKSESQTQELKNCPNSSPNRIKSKQLDWKGSFKYDGGCLKLQEVWPSGRWETQNRRRRQASKQAWSLQSSQAWKQEGFSSYAGGALSRQDGGYSLDTIRSLRSCWAEELRGLGCEMSSLCRLNLLLTCSMCNNTHTDTQTCNATLDGLMPIELVPCCFALEACVIIDLSDSKASQDQYFVKTNGTSLCGWIAFMALAVKGLQ